MSLNSSPRPKSLSMASHLLGMSLVVTHATSLRAAASIMAGGGTEGACMGHIPTWGRLAPGVDVEPVAEWASVKEPSGFEVSSKKDWVAVGKRCSVAVFRRVAL